MLVNFNSKYFTIAAILLAIYLVRDVQSQRGEGIKDFGTDVSAPHAQYVLEIDPNKADSERSFLEKMLYKYTMTKKLEKQVKQDSEDAPQYSAYPSPAVVGDSVTIRLREINSANNVEMPMTLVIGSGLLHKSIEDALVGMKVGEKKEVVHQSSNQAEKKFEVQVMAIVPKSEGK